VLLELKSLAEKAFGHAVHIGKSASSGEVEELIRLVRPRPIGTPLVRFGAHADGGYLLPDDLAGIRACISPGVSDQIGFDVAMTARGIDVFMADGSVDGPPVDDPRFHFTRRFLDSFEDDTHIRLDHLAASTPEGDRILQMDIEGAEYRVLPDASDAVLQSFRIMVVEFHSLNHLFSKFGLPLIRATFQKLLRFHHVVHIHPNNVSPAISRGGLSVPDVMEFTFWRKDRADVVDGRPLAFPHSLDADNHPHLPPLVLPACWS
jgi:hypothetical protein